MDVVPPTDLVDSELADNERHARLGRLGYVEDATCPGQVSAEVEARAAPGTG